jgi:histidine ammonia-lyase
VTVRIGQDLSLGDVSAVARGEAVELAADAIERIRISRAVVEAGMASGDMVYGVTTGFGSLANVRIPPEDASRLQQAIVRSHATGVGRPLSRQEARAMLVLRAHTLALGHSGVRIEIVERMVEMLNKDLVPYVPEQGSLGASGDLAPLASLALPLVGGGEVLATDGAIPAMTALTAVGLTPLTLESKEGLALVNGTQGMLAIGILAFERIANLARTADVVAAMTIEAALGSDRVFDPRLQRLRPHRGCIDAASNIWRLLSGSEIVASHRTSNHLVQDAYSLRCAPQVHGATREVLRFAEGIFDVEVESVSDNPVVLPLTDEVLSGGNFHGQPVAAALDALALATVPLASMSERRMFRLLNEDLSDGLPPFLVLASGVNSGLMLLQYTAASLVSECKSLAHPASIDSIPSSANQEDHVSMGMTSARHCRDVVANAEVVVALELLCAAQALDFREPLNPAAGTRAAYEVLRERVSFLNEDRELRPDIDAAIELVRSGALVAEVERQIGSLD